jgi:hypothetical protein
MQEISPATGCKEADSAANLFFAQVSVGYQPQKLGKITRAGLRKLQVAALPHIVPNIT